MKVPLIVYNKESGNFRAYLATQTLLLVMCENGLEEDAKEVARVFNGKIPPSEVSYGYAILCSFSWARTGNYRYFSDLHRRLHYEGIYDICKSLNDYFE